MQLERYAFGRIAALARRPFVSAPLFACRQFFSSLRACQGSPFRRPPKAAALRAVLDKLSGMKNAPPCERWIKLDRFDLKPFRSKGKWSSLTHHSHGGAN